MLESQPHRARRAAEPAIGIVGTKGFIGGFPTRAARLRRAVLRRVYAETTAEVAGSTRACGDRGLPAADRPAALRADDETLVGEPAVIWAFLGSEPDGRPIARSPPRPVLTATPGGTFESSIDDVPVYNVAVPVLDGTSGFSSPKME